MQPDEPQLEEPKDSREPDMEKLGAQRSSPCREEDGQSKKGKEGWALGLEASCHFSHQGTFSTKPSSEPTLDEQPEPTVTFLFTLLNTPEPKDDDETDTELESQFVDQDDWGPRRTSKEIQLLQRDCRRLQESLYTSQRENLVLEEKLENLPTLLYEDLEDIMLIPEESKVTQETAEDSQDRAEDIQEEEKDIQEEAEDTQNEARVTQQEPEDTQERAEDTQKEAVVTQEEVQTREQPKRASVLRYSFDTPIPLPATTLFPEDSTGMLCQSVSPSLSPSNKDHH